MISLCIKYLLFELNDPKIFYLGLDSDVYLANKNDDDYWLDLLSDLTQESAENLRVLSVDIIEEESDLIHSTDLD